MSAPVPCQWWLVRPAPHDLCGVTVDRMPQMSGPDLYAVHWRSSDLSKSGDWDWRPIPSSRTDEWLAALEEPAGGRDRIDELEPGARVLAHSTVRPDLELFQDHFPGFPVVPGVLLTEMMGQTAAKCLDDFDGFSLKQAQEIMEEELIVKALDETGGNRVQASKLLEISYPSLLSKIKKYGITRSTCDDLQE